MEIDKAGGGIMMFMKEKTNFLLISHFQYVLNASNATNL